MPILHVVSRAHVDGRESVQTDGVLAHHAWLSVCDEATGRAGIAARVVRVVVDLSLILLEFGQQQRVVRHALHRLRGVGVRGNVARLGDGGRGDRIIEIVKFADV